MKKLITYLDNISFLSICGMAVCFPFSARGLKSFFYIGLGCLIIRKIWEYRFKARPLFKKNYLNKPFLLFLSAMLLATLLSKNFYESQKVFVERILLYAGIFFLVKETVDSKRKIYWFLGTTIAIAFIIGIDALWQYFTGFDLFFSYPKADPGVGKIIAVSGPFVKYNAFSGYLELILPLVVFLVLLPIVRKRSYLSICMYITLGMLLFSWIYVFQRTTWVSVSLSIIVVSLWVDKRLTLGIVFFFIFIVFLLPPGVYQRISGTFQPGGDTDRFEMWQLGISFLDESLLIGNGLGGYARCAYRTMLTSNLHVHNTYLELLIDTGLVGFLSFFYLLAMVMKQSFFAFSRIVDKKKKIILGGLLAPGLSYFIAGFFSTNMIVGVGFSSMFWVLLTLAAILPDLEFTP